MSNKIQLQTNNTNLDAYGSRIDVLIDIANSLPEAGGVALPKLTSPATANEIFLNKETIDEDGNVLTGTFTIDTELNENEELITQIQTALARKSSISLPTLENPATSAEILSGYEAIDADGNVIVGECSGGSGGGNGADNWFAIFLPYTNNTIFELIPFQTGMTWADFHTSALAPAIFSTQNYGFGKIYDDGRGNAAYYYYDINTMDILYSLIFDTDGVQVGWDDVIQPIDLDTLSPIYTLEV